jgi:hypothetical protein
MGFLLIVIVAFAVVGAITWTIKTPPPPKKEEEVKTSSVQNSTADATASSNNTRTLEKQETADKFISHAELEILLSNHREKMLGVIVRGILLAMFIWTVVCGVIVGLLMTAK